LASSLTLITQILTGWSAEFPRPRVRWIGSPQFQAAGLWVHSKWIGRARWWAGSISCVRSLLCCYLYPLISR